MKLSQLFEDDEEVQRRYHETLDRYHAKLKELSPIVADAHELRLELSYYDMLIDMEGEEDLEDFSFEDFLRDHQNDPETVSQYYQSMSKDIKRILDKVIRRRGIARKRQE